MKRYTIEKIKNNPINIKCKNKEEATKIYQTYGFKDIWNVGYKNGKILVTCYQQKYYPTWMDDDGEFFKQEYGITETIEFSQIDFQETPEDILKHIIIW